MEKRLTALEVTRLTEPGRHADGGNLYLFIRKTAKGTVSRAWTFKYEKGGKSREMGLGSVVRVSLAQARAKAAKCRAQLDKGIDPLVEKEAPAPAPVTFLERANAYVEVKGAGWNKVHKHQWQKAIDDYLKPIADMPVGEIDTAAVLRCLKPLWQRVPATGRKVRGKIEMVLDSAKALGLRSGENPAAWRGHLALILPGRGRVERAHHEAMNYDDLPEFVRSLREQGSTAALALEFAILTPARSGEVRYSRWNEIDLGAKVWSIPASRMKSGREHRVPLCDRALAILEQLAERRSCDFIFPGIKINTPIGKTAMAELVPAGATVHGFRSTFRDWAGNETAFPREIAEQALAHASGDSTEQAYRRSDALERRRALMAAWASFCEPAAAAGVIQLAGRR